MVPRHMALQVLQVLKALQAIARKGMLDLQGLQEPQDLLAQQAIV